MAAPKAWLPFGPERLLQRVVRLVGEAVRPVVVTAHAGQELPELPPWCHVVYDRTENQGPMEGLAAALEQLQGRAELAFVAGCDAPLLEPRLVHRMLALAPGFDAAVPHVDGLDHPLAAVYRTQLPEKIGELLARGSRRLTALFDEVRTRRSRGRRVDRRGSVPAVAWQHQHSRGIPGRAPAGRPCRPFGVWRFIAAFHRATKLFAYPLPNAKKAAMNCRTPKADDLFRDKPRQTSTSARN